MRLSRSTSARFAARASRSNRGEMLRKSAASNVVFVSIASVNDHWLDPRCGF
jgi:hypothetical protein